MNERLKPVLTTYFQRVHHVMVLNFKHLNKLRPILTFITNRLQNSHLWRSYCWKSSVPNSTWRLLTDSNLLKWNIFYKGIIPTNGKSWFSGVWWLAVYVMNIDAEGLSDGNIPAKSLVTDHPCTKVQSISIGWYNNKITIGLTTGKNK